MSEVRALADGRLAVTGDLLFQDAVSVCVAGRALIAGMQASRIEVTLAGLARVNSVSAVVLVEWQRTAVALGKQLVVMDLPPHLVGILRVSGLDEVLGNV